jgi:hypothetical protein
MEEAPPQTDTAALIRSLPTLPKARLAGLWKDSFGKPAGAGSSGTHASHSCVQNPGKSLRGSFPES